MKSRMGCIQYTVTINEARERERDRERERGGQTDLLHSIQLVGYSILVFGFQGELREVRMNLAFFSHHWTFGIANQQGGGGGINHVLG